METETTDTATTTATTETNAPVVETTDVAEVVEGGDDDGTALGGKVADEPDADARNDAPVIPETYELTAPEGMTLDADLLADATPVFKELGLTNETASKLLPFAGKLIEKTTASIETQMIEAGAAQRKAWLDDAKKAEDIGGPAWDATMHTASKGLDALGYTEGSPFRQFLTETGIGNHPDMIRIAAKLGALVSEDGEFARADAGAMVEETREQRWYSNKE